MLGEKEIRIRFVESGEQRYPTCGDYQDMSEYHLFTITKQDNWRKNLLIFLHEFIEYSLCEDREIPEQMITDYDLEWNRRLEAGEVLADEPGNEPDNNIYKNEHRIAENFERLFAEYLGVDWFEYDKNLII